MRRIAQQTVTAVSCLLALVLVPAAVAHADLRSEEGQGRRILVSVRAGERECSALSADEFELIGEYAMGRYLRDTAGHESMNRHMVAVMGEQGERRMHVALGYRFSGCHGGPAWSWMGQMAGMMRGGWASRGGPSGYGPAMMDRGVDRDEGFGMMGSGWSRSDGDGISGAWAAAMIGMMAALVASVAIGVFWLTRRRSSD